MQSLASQIVGRLLKPWQRVAEVNDPFNFLSDPLLREDYMRETGKDINTLLRITPEGTSFIPADLFPRFQDRRLLNHQPYEVLRELAKRKVGLTPEAQGRAVIDRIKEDLAKEKALAQTAAQTTPQTTIGGNRDALARADARQCAADPMLMGRLFERTLQTEGYSPALQKLTGDANALFQNWVRDNHAASLNSSPLIRPASVNNILPHIAHTLLQTDRQKNNGTQKIALVVVDGMALWQWEILKRSLCELGVTAANEDFVYAWLPTITRLSRQAIFRGAAPQSDYKQCPQSEKKLWKEFWTRRGVPEHDIDYITLDDYTTIGGSDLPATQTAGVAQAIGEARLAVVCDYLDSRMHTCGRIEELSILTREWAPRFAPAIKQLKEAGYTVYLTSDHGNVQARGWRSLTPQEKVYLYADGSRGKRHLIFTDADARRRFADENAGKLCFHSNNQYIVIEDTEAFATPGKLLVTHGGSHLLELAVPFVKI